MSQPININLKESLENRKTPWVLLVIAIVVIILMRQCNGVDKVGDLVCNCDESYYELRTVYRDTGSIQYISEVLPVHDTIHDTIDRLMPIPTVIDTQAILREYYRLYSLLDSFTGQDVKVLLYDTLGTNRLIARRWVVSNTRETSIIQPLRKQRVQFYVGMGLGSRHELPLRADIYPSLALKTKKDLLISANYGVFEKRIGVTVFYKIKLRKD